MSDFISFARALGIMIDSPPPIGYWRRYPTEDHPRKRNGAVKFMGDHAFIQNWATDQEVVVWKADENAQIDMNRLRRDAAAAEKKRRIQQEAASKRSAAAIHSVKRQRIGVLLALRRTFFTEDAAPAIIAEKGTDINIIS